MKVRACVRHTVPYAGRLMHFPAAVYIKGRAGYVFRPIGG